MKDIKTFIREQYCLCAVFSTTENAVEMAKKTAGEIVEYGASIGDDPMMTVLNALATAIKLVDIDDTTGVFTIIVDIWKKCLANVFGIACVL